MPIDFILQKIAARGVLPRWPLSELSFIVVTFSDVTEVGGVIKILFAAICDGASHGNVDRNLK